MRQDGGGEKAHANDQTVFMESADWKPTLRRSGRRFDCLGRDGMLCAIVVLMLRLFGFGSRVRFSLYACLILLGASHFPAAAADQAIYTDSLQNG